jgi:hypothetical protein
MAAALGTSHYAIAPTVAIGGLSERWRRLLALWKPALTPAAILAQKNGTPSSSQPNSSAWQKAVCRYDANGAVLGLNLAGYFRTKC